MAQLAPNDSMQIEHEKSILLPKLLKLFSLIKNKSSRLQFWSTDQYFQKVVYHLGMRFFWVDAISTKISMKLKNNIGMQKTEA